jgi:hypothetical protein
MAWGETDRGRSLSPVRVQAYLGGAAYPASKDELLRRARENAAPEDVVRLLERMEREKFARAVDVTREVGRLMPEAARSAVGPSPAAVLSYLKGVSFPASRATLIETAERQHAPAEVLGALRRIAEGEYPRVVDVSKEIGKLR